MSSSLRKRSRLVRSKSADAVDLATPRPRNSRAWLPRRAEGKKVTYSAGQASSSIFSICSMVEEMRVATAEEDDEKGRGFLDKCFYCNEGFSFVKDIFMYSDLRAFCTVECREKQIEIEGVEELIVGSKKVKKNKAVKKSKAVTACG